MSNFFKFEDKIDIPFYNGTPELSKLAWVGLLLAVIIYTIVIRNQDIIVMSDIPFAIISVVIFLIPLVYATQGKLSMFFKKIRRQDIKSIILYTIASFILSEILMGIFIIFSLDPSIVIKSFTSDLAFNIETLIGTIIQLIAEELYKVFLLILFMAAFYRFSKNRKRSMGIAIFITLMIFGATHEGGQLGSLFKVLVVQGLGSIFDLLLYIKTKNIFVSYTSHLIFDLIPNIMGLATYLAG